MNQARHALSRGDSLLVAEYVCGLLQPDERAHVHVLLSRNDQALAEALAWEEDLLALVDALPPATPGPDVQQRLQRTLGIGPPPAFQPPPQPQLLRRPSREPGSGKVAPAVESAPSVPSVPPPQVSAAQADAQSAAESDTPPAYTEWNHQAAGLLNAAEPATEAPLGNRKEPTPAPTPPVAAPAAPPVTQFSPEPAASPTSPQPVQPSSQPKADAAPGKAQHSPARKLWVWRLIGICATIAAIVAFMLPGEPPPPPIQVVKVAPTRAAILQAPGTTSTPGWTATLGPEGDLMMQPLVRTEVPVGSQALLWTRSEQIPEPRLLGRIDPNQPVQVPANLLGALANDQLLEITLETDEDAAKGSPNGPILFIGQMTVFGSEGSSLETAGAAASASAGPVTQ